MPLKVLACSPNTFADYILVSRMDFKTGCLITMAGLQQEIEDLKQSKADKYEVSTGQLIKNFCNEHKVLVGCVVGATVIGIGVIVYCCFGGAGGAGGAAADTAAAGAGAVAIVAATEISSTTASTAGAVTVDLSENILREIKWKVADQTAVISENVPNYVTGKLNEILTTLQDDNGLAVGPRPETWVPKLTSDEVEDLLEKALHGE